MIDDGTLVHVWSDIEVWLNCWASVEFAPRSHSSEVSDNHHFQAVVLFTNTKSI